MIFHPFNVASLKKRKQHCLAPRNLMIYHNGPIEFALNLGSDPFFQTNPSQISSLLVELRKTPMIMLMASPSSSILTMVMDKLQCCTNLKTQFWE